MTTHSTKHRPRLIAALVAVMSLVLALAIGAPGTASGASSLPKPTSVSAQAFTDPAFIAQRLAGAPPAAIPTVLAGPGDSFIVRVSLFNGTSPAAYPNKQTVTFAIGGPGRLSQVTATIPAGSSTTDFAVSYSTGAPNLAVTVQVAKLVAATTNSFAIQSALAFLPGNSPSLLGGTAGADGSGCSSVGAANPLCGLVTLPNGATSQVALSLGPCPAGITCSPGEQLTQMIANLTRADGSDLYDAQHPATLTLVCDRSLCGSGGVSSYTALWSQSATGGLTPVPPCTSKGVIDTGLQACTDYVSSTRSNSDQLLLKVLFEKDVRIIIG